MVEWHVTPDYIVTHWTDELFDLMCEKLVERKERERKPKPKDDTVSDKALFKSMGVNVKVRTKHGN